MGGRPRTNSETTVAGRSSAAAPSITEPFEAVIPQIRIGRRPCVVMACGSKERCALHDRFDRFRVGMACAFGLCCNSKTPPSRSRAIAELASENSDLP